MNKEALINYLLWLGDNNLIMGQRLAELCGHGPFLEEDIALTNLSLDHIGQTQLIYDYAAELRGKNESHDDLAYLRDVAEFRNSLIVELPNGDFAQTICKIFFFSGFQLLLYEELSKSSDTRLAEIATKALKEVKYHYVHSESWMLRLGDGTEESHQRMQEAVDTLWQSGQTLVSEEDENDRILAKEGIAPLPSELKEKWLSNTKAILAEATLKVEDDFFPQNGGKSGKHSEHLGHLISELQFLQRAYPGNEW